ncbi:MAG: hypothetical protein QM775_07585 [Pirellulales bacterium]
MFKLISSDAKVLKKRLGDQPMAEVVRMNAVFGDREFRVGLATL